MASDDSMFSELNSIQPTLSKNNQCLVDALKNIFGEFRTKIIADIQDKIESSFADLKSDCISNCQAKDAKIAELESNCDSLSKKIEALEDKFEAAEAYGRRDAVVISGAVPAVTHDENIKNITVQLIKDKLGSDIVPGDISVAHRLQVKRPVNQETPRPPNIYVKFVRRDTKKMVILASKNQPRQASSKIFVNESLTPQRTAVFRTLLNLKKNHQVIKGVSSMEGDVFVYTPAPAGVSRSQGGSQSQGAARARDIRHRVNNRRQLLKFCRDFLQEALEEVVNTFPVM